MAEKKRIWFITGASTGFGRLLAEETLKAGNTVIVTARKVEQVTDLEEKYPGKALALTLDVTKREVVAEAVEKTIAKFGHIDVLVNNAGYGQFGALEEVSDEQIERQIDTNVFGVLWVTRAWLPHLRKQRSGHIVNLSSIAGVASSPGLGMYNLTKFAVEGVSEALAQEVGPLGIKVTLIEPGPFRTDFAGRSMGMPAVDIEDYAATAGAMRKMVQGYAGAQKGDPMRAVRQMMALVDDENPPLRLLMGALAVRRFREKTTAWTADVDKWEAVSLSMDFPE